jgi:two-component system sensor histidine kinase ArlS
MSKKRGKSNVSGSRLTDRIRSSLVLKLNIQMLGQLLVVFLLGNIFISIIFFAATLWRIESGALGLVNVYEKWQDTEDIGEEHILVAGSYRIVAGEEGIKGVRVPDLLQRWLPLKKHDARRGIVIPNLPGKECLLDRIEQAEYHISMEFEEVSYHITYALGEELRIYRAVILIILGFQMIYFIISIGENTQVIRRILKPLSEMAETARSLQEDMTSLEKAVGGSGIKDLAGAISTIDANRLNRRVAVDNIQAELKDLAHAINSMLERISQSYQSQVRFVSDASHELRTPISVIQGYVNLLDRWGKHDEKTMQECITAIKTETESMKLLVEQLLFLARGDNETIMLHKTVFDVSQVVDEIVRESRLIDSSHVFETHLEPEAYICGDQQLIKQAIRILVDNSVKYTPAEEKIVFRVMSKESNVHIQVQDNGIGIAAEDIPHIFNRFYRSDESRARKTGGSGLGLAIAKWIIERHDGHFDVLSRVDIGTRITVVLPSVPKPSYNENNENK